MKNNISEEIQDLGFTNNEAKIYLACLELGKGSVTQISKKVGLNRTTGYEVLERLAMQGLINFDLSKTKKRIYSAMPPSRLKQHLENKRNLFEKRLQKLEKTLPDLQLLYKETETKPVIKIVEGVEAMKQMASQELDTNDVIYSFANLENYAEVFEEMGKQRSMERFVKGIKEKCLSIDGKYAREWHKKVYGGKKKRQENTEYRWLATDKNKYPTAGEIVIFEDKVIGIMSKTSENSAFEIKSATFANFLKILFEIAWEKMGKK